MGLDPVELILEVEDAFDISITDDHAQQVRTVGDLFELIRMNRRQGASRICLSAATFRLLRRSLVDEDQPHAAQLRPKDPIEYALPISGRRQIWNSVQRSSRLRFPDLSRPTWLVLLLFLVACSVGLNVGNYCWPISGSVAVLLALGTAIGSGVLLGRLSRPFATRIPSGLSTLGDLTNALVTCNYAALAERFDTWNHAEAWYVLQSIVVEQLGVKREQVTPKARFVEDLGVY